MRFLFALPVLATLVNAQQQLCNGYTEYCTKPINKILFAATHNSFAVVSKAMDTPPLATNQNPAWTIDKQLKDGVRALDLDLWMKDGEVHVCHGGCGIDSNLFFLPNC